MTKNLNSKILFMQRRIHRVNTSEYVHDAKFGYKKHQMKICCLPENEVEEKKSCSKFDFNMVIGF